MKTYKLSDINVGDRVRVAEIGKSEQRQRFIDLGIVEGALIKCVGISPGRDMRAYRIRGSVIAIRNSDCSNVFVLKGDGAIWD